MKLRLAAAAAFVIFEAALLAGCGDSNKPPAHPAAANCWAHFDHATPASRHCDTDGMDLVDGVWLNPDTNKPINGT